MIDIEIEKSSILQNCTIQKVTIFKEPEGLRHHNLRHRLKIQPEGLKHKNVKYGTIAITNVYPPGL